MTEITKDTSGLITQVKRNGIAVTMEIMKERLRPCLCIRFDGDPGVYKVASFDNTMKAQWFQDIMEEFFRDVEPNKPKPPTLEIPTGFDYDANLNARCLKHMEEVINRIGAECSEDEKIFALWDDQCCPPDGPDICPGEDARCHNKDEYYEYCWECWRDFFRKEAEAKDDAG